MHCDLQERVKSEAEVELEKSMNIDKIQRKILRKGSESEEDEEGVRCNEIYNLHIIIYTLGTRRF